MAVSCILVTSLPPSHRPAHLWSILNVVTDDMNLGGQHRLRTSRIHRTETIDTLSSPRLYLSIRSSGHSHSNNGILEVLTEAILPWRSLPSCMWTLSTAPRRCTRWRDSATKFARATGISHGQQSHIVPMHSASRLVRSWDARLSLLLLRVALALLKADAQD